MDKALIGHLEDYLGIANWIGMYSKHVKMIQIIGWDYQLTAVQNEVCSDFCSGLGMSQSSPVATSTKYIYQRLIQGVDGVASHPP